MGYVERYVNLWQYIWENWVDHKHGAWLGFKMTRDNKRFNEEKAIAGGKCDYHTLVSCVEALRAFQTKLAVPDNFWSKEFLTKHIEDILSFYEPRVVDETGGFFQSFKADGTLFNPNFRQIVSSAR